MSKTQQDKDLALGGPKREIKPIFTKGYKHIPHLKEKLLWLYGFLQGIRSQRDHAAAIGVSPAAFSTWINGSLFKDRAGNAARANPESIPAKYYGKFVKSCGLPSEILDLPDFSEFKAALDHFEISAAGSAAGWEKLIGGLPEDDRIEIIAENATRTLVDPEEEEADGIPRYRVGDRIMVRVANHAWRYGLLLEEDRGGWIALRPSRRVPETTLDGPLLFPRQSPGRPPRFARLDGVGLHRVLVILTKTTLPAGVLEVLMQRPIDAGKLNYFASVLQKRCAGDKEACLFMSRRFVATAV
jgi:hypothetical protein